MFDNLTILQMVLSGFAAIIIFVLGYRIGKFFAARRGKLEMKLIDKERHDSDRSYKKLLDEEQDEMVLENEKVRKSNSTLILKIADYRKKLAGIGGFSFSANRRKRADIMYSLLLENEALEQLLMEYYKKEPDEISEHLIHQMEDAQKKHPLIMKIFDNDEMIKAHVRNALFNDGNIKLIGTDSEPKAITEAPLKDKNVAESTVTAK